MPVGPLNMALVHTKGYGALRGGAEGSSTSTPAPPFQANDATAKPVVSYRAWL